VIKVISGIVILIIGAFFYKLYKIDNTNREFAHILNTIPEFMEIAPLQILEKNEKTCVRFSNRFFSIKKEMKSGKFFIKKRTVNDKDCVVAIFGEKEKELSIIYPENKDQIKSILKGECVDLVQKLPTDVCEKEVSSVN